MSENRPHIFGYPSSSSPNSQGEPSDPDIVYIPVPRAYLTHLRKAMRKATWTVVVCVLSIVGTLSFVKRDDASCGHEQHQQDKQVERGDAGETRPSVNANTPRAPRRTPKSPKGCTSCKAVIDKKTRETD